MIHVFISTKELITFGGQSSKHSVTEWSKHGVRYRCHFVDHITDS